MQKMEILGELYWAPDWFSDSDVCTVKLQAALDGAILSMRGCASAKKREATYRFILECYDRLLKYCETHPNPETPQCSEQQQSPEATEPQR